MIKLIFEQFVKLDEHDVITEMPWPKSNADKLVVRLEYFTTPNGDKCARVLLAEKDSNDE